MDGLLLLWEMGVGSGLHLPEVISAEWRIAFIAVE